MRPDFKVLLMILQTGTETKLEKAQITLNDCLACSGCITSAESVLITQQSQEELYRVLQENLRLEQVHYTVKSMMLTFELRYEKTCVQCF